jgi:hypothetical protein
MVGSTSGGLGGSIVEFVVGEVFPCHGAGVMYFDVFFVVLAFAFALTVTGFSVLGRFVVRVCERQAAGKDGKLGEHGTPGDRI